MVNLKIYVLLYYTLLVIVIMVVSFVLRFSQSFMRIDYRCMMSVEVKQLRVHPRDKNASKLIDGRSDISGVKIFFS